MSQTTDSVNDNRIEYTVEELQLFAETACVKIPLDSIKSFLETHNYSSYLLKETVLNISKGNPCSGITSITDTAKAYHEELYDILFIKTLDDLPLMVNCDWSISPVLSWRFQIGK